VPRAYAHRIPFIVKMNHSELLNAIQDVYLDASVTIA
jgi:hypothetical protein